MEPPGSGKGWLPPADETAKSKPCVHDQHVRSIGLASAGDCESASSKLSQALTVNSTTNCEAMILDEEEDLIASTENFEEITVEVTADSGAGKHVSGPDVVEGYPIEPSEGSRTNRHFIGPSGERITNHGQTSLNLESNGQKLQGLFQIADVTRMLMSVSQMCDHDCEVHFNKQRGQVTNSKGKVVATFPRKGGLYTAQMTLKAPRIGARPEAPGFTRQGVGA